MTEIKLEVGIEEETIKKEGDNTMFASMASIAKGWPTPKPPIFENGVGGNAAIEGCAVLQIGEILTRKDGSKWEVSGYGTVLKDAICVIIKPKPKRLSGWVNVYDELDDDGYCIEYTERKEEADDFASEVFEERRKRIACIDLSQFEEGYGLDMQITEEENK